MGLAQPIRSLYAVRQYTPLFEPQEPYVYWNVDTGFFVPDFVAIRNFDPESLTPSHYIDDVLYSGDVVVTTNQSGALVYIQTYQTDPTAVSPNAVADEFPYAGSFFLSLTRDDVGGATVPSQRHER